MLLSQTVVWASVAGLTVASPAQWKKGSKAIYIQTNEPKGNSIVALPINDDGTLGTGAIHSTSGKGGAHVEMQQPTTPDALLSQSSVAVVGTTLFVTNAMSNSVTQFSINSRNATDLTCIGSYTLPKGDFPTTVAASKKHKRVCVATTGLTNGITCASYSPTSGLGQFDNLRSFGLTQTTPPSGPPNTVSQLQFTENEKFLLATVKADPPNNKTGFVAVYAIADGKVVTEPVRSSPKDTAILFGFDQIPSTNNFLVTDPSIGAAILSLDTTSCEVSTLHAINITGQAATCWSAISAATGTGFVADGGMDRLVEIDLKSGAVLSVTDLTSNGDPGLFDMRAQGEFLYALSPGNGSTMPSVTVVEAKSKKMVQHVGLKGYGVSSYAQGMAVYA